MSLSCPHFSPRIKGNAHNQVIRPLNVRQGNKEEVEVVGDGCDAGQYSIRAEHRLCHTLGVPAAVG